MARWAENRDGTRRLTNERAAVCASCGEPIEPGRGRVWSCSGLNCDGEHAMDARGRVLRAWHCTCLDAQACRRRRTPAAPGVRELAASAREAWQRLQAAGADHPKANGDAPLPSQVADLPITPEDEWIEALGWWTTAPDEVEWPEEVAA